MKRFEKSKTKKQKYSLSIYIFFLLSLIIFVVVSFIFGVQVFWMWCCSWWMHTNLCSISIFGDSIGTGYIDRSRLCSCRKWMRMQTEIRNRSHSRSKGNTLAASKSIRCLHTHAFKNEKPFLFDSEKKNSPFLQTFEDFVRRWKQY